MSYPVKVYADENGDFFGASQTDQKFTQAFERTRYGRPVKYVGIWYPSQFNYRPFISAVTKAARELNK